MLQMADAPAGSTATAPSGSATLGGK